MLFFALSAERAAWRQGEALAAPARGNGVRALRTMVRSIAEILPPLSVCGTEVHAAHPTCVDRQSDRCTAYLLGEGSAFAPPHELAERRSRPGLKVVPVNAALLGSEHVFVRIAPENVTQARRHSWKYRMEGIAWLHCTAAAKSWHIERTWAPAQDPRVVRWLGSNLVFYSEPSTCKRLPSSQVQCSALQYGSITPSNSQVFMVMRNLSALSSRRASVRLEAPSRWCDMCAPAPKRNWEKNWTPFVTPSGELLLSYALEPHVLVRCDFASGQCPVAHYSTAASLWASNAGTHTNTTARTGPRGSSPVVNVRGVSISSSSPV